MVGVELGDRTPLDDELDSLINQMVAPVVITYDIHFRPNKPKIFLKASLASYTQL